MFVLIAKSWKKLYQLRLDFLLWSGFSRDIAAKAAPTKDIKINFASYFGILPPKSGALE